MDAAESGQESGRLQRLLDDAKRGDEAAMNELFETHKQRLLDSIRAELGDRLRQRLESQDVMQQVYLDALKRIDRFEAQGRDSFLAWLRRIAVHRICDVDRRAFQTQKRGREVRAGDLEPDASMAGLLDALAASAASPSQVVEVAEKTILLRQAMEQLGDDQREVIRLRYLNQLSVAETAAKMDRSERAVRSLCVRALIRLRGLLADAL